MNPKVILRVRGEPVYWNGKLIQFTAGMTIDADGANGQGGSGHGAYHPDGSPPGLDYLGNAGHTGNWWGVVTHNGRRNGIPVIQTLDDPAPGFHVSATTYERRKYKPRDPRRYVDSETVPYVVIPGPLRGLVAPVFIGCLAHVENSRNGRKCVAVVADTGPSTHLGEGSIALAKALGVPSSPKKGGTDDKIIRYTIYPGTPATVNGETFVLQPA